MKRQRGIDQLRIGMLGKKMRYVYMRFQPVKCNMMQLTKADQKDPSGSAVAQW